MTGYERDPILAGPISRIAGAVPGCGWRAAAAGGVAFRLKKPDASFLTIAAVEDPARANEWIGYVVADQAGVWTVKASCSTPRPAVEQQSFSVMASLPG